MPYIGRDLSQGNYLKLDDISSQFDGNKVSFDLKAGGTNFFPGSSLALMVALGGVIQEAEAAYTISQSSIEFAAAPANGLGCFIIVLGTSIGVSVPADGSVTTAKLAQSAIQSLGTIGIQSGGTSIGTGVTMLNFVGTGNTFLVSGSGALKKVDISIEGGGAGGGTTFTKSASGIHTTDNIGIRTTGFPTEMVGAGNSFAGMYISNGMTVYDNKLNGNHYISTNFNGLMAGPVTVNGVLTVDGNYVVV